MHSSINRLDLSFCLLVATAIYSPQVVCASSPQTDGNAANSQPSQNVPIAADAYYRTAEPTAPKPTAQPAPVTGADAAAKKKAEDAKKKSAEELKKKVATAYKDPFYQNDFSFLKDPNYNGFHLGEDLKQVAIGPGMLDFGGQYRLRYHNERNMRGAGLTGRDDEFLLDRTRFYFDYKANKRLRLVSEFLDAGSSWEQFTPRAIEVNHLDAQNLFVDGVLIDDCSGKLTGRVGRQELLFGAQRLISPLDWANTRRTFDGARLTWSNSDRQIDGFWTRPVIVNIDRFDSPNLDQQFYGIHAQNKTFVNSQVDTYYLGFHNELIDQRVHTLGGRVAGEADSILWDNEAGYQFGHNPDGSEISAAAITVGLGRKLGGNMKPALWMYYDWASGDRSVGNGWNHLFPLGHKYLGFMDLFGRRNINDVNAQLAFAPSDKWNVLLWYHYFFLADGNQGPYNIVLAPFNGGGTVGSRDVGHEIDVLATRKMSARSDLVLGYSHFFAGKYYDLSQTSSGAALFNGDADFFYTQWHVNF